MKYSKDGRIAFDAKWHTYTNVETGKRLTGVTSLIGRYKNKFDAEAIATAYAAKNGLDKDTVLAEWAAKGQRSRDAGTAVHKVFENYVLTGIAATSGEYAKEEVAIKFINEMFETGRLEPVETEMIVYNDEVASQIDLVVKDRSGRYYILDPKTNSTIETNGYNKFMLHPFHVLPDASFYHYSLQLAIYKRLCTEYPIAGTFIVHIDETDYRLMRPENITIPDNILGIKTTVQL